MRRAGVVLRTRAPVTAVRRLARAGAADAAAAVAAAVATGGAETGKGGKKALAAVGGPGFEAGPYDGFEVAIGGSADVESGADDRDAPSAAPPAPAETLSADFVLLTTGGGGRGHRLAASLGHSLVPPIPSLFTFTVKDELLRELAGVSFESVSARLSVERARLKGTPEERSLGGGGARDVGPTLTQARRGRCWR